MRRLLIAAGAAALLVTPAPSLAEECLDKKLSGAALEQCLGKKNLSESGDVTKIAKPTEEIKYPILLNTRDNVIFKHDPTAKQDKKHAEISSEDGTKLTIGSGIFTVGLGSKYKSEESLSIPSQNIIGWNISNQAYQNSSGAINTVVAGALVFWPMMLLAPLGVREDQILHLTILYLDELGSKQSVYLNAYDKNSAQRLIGLVRAVSQQEAGFQKTDKELAGSYKVIQEELKAKVISLRSSLLVPNKKKPWCEQIDTKSLPNIYAKYQLLYARLQKIQESLEMPVLQLTDGSNNGEQWNNWLSQNPNQAIWAKSNPAAADKMRRCGVKA